MTDVTRALYENDVMQAEEPHTPLFDPKPLVEAGRRWSRWLGPLIAFAVLVASIVKLSTLHVPDIWQQVLATTPAFWLAFVISYFVGPVTDWLIFHRLWNIPASGIFALLRKQLTNALLPSYSGEVYFYTWARKRSDLTGAPFGAIKDVAIISALTGNVFTLAMLIVAYPLFGSRLGGLHIENFALSIGFLTLGSVIVMLFRGRLFSLPARELWHVAAIVMVRTVANTAALGLMWHFAMPVVDLTWWLLLATIKLLLSRLPFVPNIDIVFVGVVVVFIGHGQQQIQDLVVMVVGITYVTHAALGLILGAIDLLTSREVEHA